MTWVPHVSILRRGIALSSATSYFPTSASSASARCRASRRFCFSLSNICRSPRRPADAPRRVAQPLLEFLIERGHVGLRLLERLVEVLHLRLDALGVIAQPVAGLHRVHQCIRRPCHGPGLLHRIVGPAQARHVAGKSVQLGARAQCGLVARRTSTTTFAFTLPLGTGITVVSVLPSKVQPPGSPALAASGTGLAVHRHRSGRPVGGQAQLVAARLQHAGIAALHRPDLHAQRVAGSRVALIGVRAKTPRWYSTDTPESS